MPKVLLTDHAWPDVTVERGILAEIGVELTVAPRHDPATLATLVGDCDALMTCWAKIDQGVIAAARNCRIIARMGVGLDNIDVAAATRRGIVVTNVPDYCVTEVVEHTLALILALARNVAFYHQAAQSGSYEPAAAVPLRRLAGQTLGIIGLGSIGRRVAAGCMALGMRVIATGRSLPEPLAGVTWRTLPELLAESDFVSLHAPLAEGTRNLIGAPQFALMRPTAYLINTARGGLVDHAALAAALEAGRLAGAALDVQSPEPPDLSLPPFNHPRVIVTPHVAFISVESLLELRTRSARQVVDQLSGRRPANIVNPTVLG